MKSNDPRYIGPGYWASFHRRSYHANTREQKYVVAQSIVRDITFFPCNVCREDSLKYLEMYPIEESIEINNEFSLFIWTVDFHNWVNNKLGKRQVSELEAIEMWSDKNICLKKSCESSDEEESVHESASDESSSDEEEGENNFSRLNIQMYT